MPEAESPAQSVLEALGFTLFAREESGALRLLGEAPPWLAQLWPGLKANQERLPVADASPFLENFLIDAEESWKKGGEARAQSGPWIEQDASGADIELDATAMTIKGQPILLLERLGEAFAAKKAALQHARETVIANQLLNSEIQKKEILLHSVANEMRSCLANIITSLQLMEMQDNPERTRVLLRLAIQAGDTQQRLIERILEVFRHELEGVDEATWGDKSNAEWNAVFDKALNGVAPLFTEKGVRLETRPAASNHLHIDMDAARLERVLRNLLEDALERSPPGSAVLLQTKDEPDMLVVFFEDEGPILGPSAGENLFQRMPRGDLSPASALRLHFCRVVLEGCGGEIGYSLRPSGGNRFTIRLTKSRAAA